MEMIHISVVERPNTFSCSRGCTVGMAGSRSSLRAHPHPKSELMTHQGALMWVSREASSTKLKEKVLETLHEGLIGMVRMKGIFRGYIWWPNFDKDIEGSVRNCGGCQETANNPTHSPLQRWRYPAIPW